MWILSGTALLVLAAIVWVGVRGALAVSELQAARESVASLREQMSSGGSDLDSEQVAACADDIVARLSSARDLTGDPVWRAGEIVPLIGPNLTAVRETSDTLGRVGEDAIGPLVDLALTLEAADAASEAGELPLGPIIDAAPQLETAATTASVGAERLEAIDTGPLLAPLADAVEEIRPLMRTTADGLTVASTLSRVVPAMLGADGPRTQLALFLNNAELRSSGGIVGALAEISADGGRISLGRQSSASALKPFDEAPAPLSDQERGIFGEASGRYMVNATTFPRFSSTGRLAAEMWSQRMGLRPDGVIAVDPIALGYLLEATGPITLSTGDVLRADNVVDLLLRDVYARYSDPSDQDAFFAAAAGEVFQSLAAGGADPLSMVQALTRAGSEGRLRLWSSVPEEEELLERTPLAPGLPGADGATESFAVYYNDVTGAKMDYYLDSSVSVRQELCTMDGLPLYDIDVTITSMAPQDAASSLSAYVTGGGVYGVKPGRIGTDISVYGGEGSVFLGASRDGADLPLQSALDAGHFLAKFRTDIGPGESQTTSLRFLGTVPRVEDTRVITTPTIRGIAVESLTAGC